MESLIAIISALYQEIKPLSKRLNNLTIHRRQGFSFLQGFIADKRILLVNSGMGRNNSRALMEVLVSNFPISLIISVGYAGALKPFLQAGDIVLADKLYLMQPSHEAECPIEITDKKTTLIYRVDEKLLNLALKALQASQLKYYLGSFLTVDRIIGKPKEKRVLGEKLKPLAVDMETAAIARIAKKKGLPFIALRSISDSLEDNIARTIKFKKLKDNASFLKCFFLLLKHPRESLELIKLKKNCSKASEFLEKIILQMLNSPILI